MRPFFSLFFTSFYFVVFFFSFSLSLTLSTGRLELHPPSTIPLCFIPHGRLGREGHFQFGVVVGAEADICRPNWNTRTDTRACAWLESIDVWARVPERESWPGWVECVIFTHIDTQRRLGCLSFSCLVCWPKRAKERREGEGEVIQ